MVPRPIAGAEADLLAANGLDPFAVCWTGRPPSPPAPKACCSCPTWRANGRRTWTRTHAAPGSGSASPTIAGIWCALWWKASGSRSPIAWSGCATSAWSRPSITLTGGGARGDLWRSVLAAQLRVPVTAGTAADGPALGAAILAQVGAGVQPDLASAVKAAAAPPSPALRADPELSEHYRQLHARYRALYPALKAAGAFAGGLELRHQPFRSTP